MLLPVLVVQQRLLSKPLLRRFHVGFGKPLVLRDGDRRLQRVQRHPGVSVRHRYDVPQRLRGEERFRFPQPPVRVGQRPPEDRFEVRRQQGREDQHAAAGKEGVPDLEGRVLGGRPEQGDGPFLDGRQQRVLLRLVPPVDLVDEGDGGGGRTRGEERGDERPLPQQLLLPDGVGEGGRTHPVGEGRDHHLSLFLPIYYP